MFSAISLDVNRPARLDMRVARAAGTSVKGSSATSRGGRRSIPRTSDAPRRGQSSELHHRRDNARQLAKRERRAEADGQLLRPRQSSPRKSAAERRRICPDGR